jgi:triphosphoribosyl-dephospho-CoA synthetase
MRSSAIPDCERLAGGLAVGLTLELHLTPKPGLVDLLDNGSHRDLSPEIMERSIGRVAGCFREIAGSLKRGEPLERQVRIGRETERRLYAEFQANTHKGALFLGGLLLVALFRAEGEGEDAVRASVAAVARELFGSKGPGATNGDAARTAFGVKGIVGEALSGIPSLFDAALPAYRDAVRARRGFGTASFLMLARLMRSVEDTTALHRCGPAGLERIRRDGCALEERIVRGEDPLGFLRECNASYRRINLTMGGVADLLGIAYGWLAYRGELGGGARGGDRTRTAYSASGF